MYICVYQYKKINPKIIMKKFLYLFPIVFALLFAACSDSNDDGPTPDPELTDEEFTNKWMYSKMKSLYLWNTNLPSSPDYSKDPESFFTSLLYYYGSVNGDRFSWIEKDTSKKTKSLYASTNNGFEYTIKSYFPNTNAKTSSLGFFVTYVHKGSDAEAKGLKRGQVIYRVNNTNVDYDNYRTILNDVSSFTLSVYDNDGTQKTLGAMQLFQKKSPVLMSKVINVSDTKIGYLVYNAFERGPDENNLNNYEYDIELVNTIKDLNSQGISEFVLDLRYNPGGYLTSAMALASALVPNRKTSNIFAKEEYNSHFQDSIIKQYGQNALNEYFLDKVYGTSVEIPKLNLQKVYIIASENSASASELVIHGLKPYMTVYHVGETTVGKDKASMTVKSDSERIKWQLQPIISRLTDANGKGNYINGLDPDLEISEWDESYTMVKATYSDGSETWCPLLSEWIGGFTELGDTSEPMLAEAIAHITGIPRTKKTKSAISRSISVQVPKINYNEEKQRIIIDPDKFN